MKNTKSEENMLFKVIIKYGSLSRTLLQRVKKISFKEADRLCKGTKLPTASPKS